MKTLGKYMDVQKSGVSLALALVSAGLMSSATNAWASEKSFDLDNFTGVAAAQNQYLVFDTKCQIVERINAI